MWNSLASNALTLSIAAVVVISGVIGWGQREYTIPGRFERPACIQISYGETVQSVSNKLQDRELISNPVIFRLGTKYTGKSSKLKAGAFLIPALSSMESVADIITRGGKNTCGKEILLQIGISSQKLILREMNPDSGRYFDILSFNPKLDSSPLSYISARQESDVRYRIVVAEGVTSWQLINSLKSVNFLIYDIKDVPSEGSLLPTSYEVKQGGSASELLERMKIAQSNALQEAWKTRAAGTPLKNPEQALILASIIEKETGVESERRKVSSVFINRLIKGWKLQTDPSVIYGLTMGKRVLGRGLLQSELDLDTPYNTYLNNGLPPTPIANPGLDSIKAALNPDSTNYLFFVANGTGGHAFSENLTNHNKNVLDWRSKQKKK
jgi:UPF0755 protein